MEKLCKVSIIMPSLNVAEYIDECMQSALHQTLPEIELLCIDAGSTDGTWEKLQSYAARPEYKEKIRLFHSCVKSYGYQVNLGIDNAAGEYIGILETDDYVESDMYQTLYDIAEAADVDFVKADYDAFVTYDDGKKLFESVKLFPHETEKYGKILNPGQEIHLYAHDHNIWKGIYRKTFLLENNIRLNESKGAAFQDIGFTQQILSCAKKAIYSDRSFYRYRKDREQSSLNSIQGMAYSYGEFLHFLENENLMEKIVCIDGFFIHMVLSLECELLKTLRGVNYDANSELIVPYYAWFKKQILHAMNNHQLSIDLYQECPDLFSILNDLDGFSLKLKEEDLTLKRRMEQIVHAAAQRTVILFGAGRYGATVMHHLYQHKIPVRAICDNNRSLWNTQRYDLPVYPPAECADQFADDIYIIANKKYSKEMQEQLFHLGIHKNHIFIYSADMPKS